MGAASRNETVTNGSRARMPTPRNHPLARLLTLTCTIALLAAVTLIIVLPGTGHPPERTAADRVDLEQPANPTTVINPTAIVLPDVAAYINGLTTTVPPPPVKHGTATDVVTADPEPAPARHGSGDVEAAIAAHFGPIADQARRVADCESSLDPGNVSPGGGNWGLFQINTVHRDQFAAVTGVSWDAGVLNADANAQFARWLYDQSGWGPWACRWAA